MSWIILSAIIVTGLALMVWRASKGPSLNLETIQWAINGLLRQGYNGGFLIINIGYSKKFLQLRKYIYAPGNYGIELAFPNAKWSEQLFPKFADFCKQSGIIYSVVIEPAVEPLEFLRIDFGKDVAKAREIIKGIILKVFELDESVHLFARLENASIKDELIDRNT